MTDSEVLKLRHFFSEAKNKALGFCGLPHVSAELKSNLKDLISSAEGFDELANALSGSSADVRVLKKKLEQLQGEIKANEQKAEAFKKVIFDIVEEIKAINAESAAILKRHEEKQGNAADALAANRIKSATKKIIELITA